MIVKNGEIMKEKRLTGDYSVKSNVCEHGNTLTNECSDCNEQELFDDILGYTLSEIHDMLFISNNVVADIIDGWQKHGGMQTDDIKNKVEQEILKRLNSLQVK